MFQVRKTNNIYLDGLVLLDSFSFGFVRVSEVIFSGCCYKMLVVARHYRKKKTRVVQKVSLLQRGLDTYIKAETLTCQIKEDIFKKLMKRYKEKKKRESSRSWSLHSCMSLHLLLLGLLDISYTIKESCLSP